MKKDFDRDSQKTTSDYDVEKIIAEVNKSTRQEKEAFLTAEENNNSIQTLSAVSDKSKKDIINKINQSIEENEVKEYKNKSDIKQNFAQNRRNSFSANDAESVQKEIERGTRYNELKSMKVKSHKGRNAVLFVLGLVIILLIGAYIVGYMMTKDSFLPNTFVNGVSIGGMNVDEATEALHSDTTVTKLVLEKLNGETVTIDYSKLDYTYSTANELSKIMNGENKALWFVNLIDKSNYTISVDGSYSEDKLKEVIENASFGVTPSKNAKIVKSKDEFVIEPEVQGAIVDTQKVFEASKEAISNGVEKINLSEKNCYKKPSVVSSDLKEKLQELN